MALLPVSGPRREFVLFVVAGGLAALVNVAARVLFDLATSYDVAIVLAYLVGMTTAFVLNRLMVFTQAQGSTAGQFVRFGLVNVLAVLQVWGVSVALARGLFPAIGFEWHARTVAHLIGVISPIGVSYLLHKHFSFGRGASKG